MKWVRTFSPKLKPPPNKLKLTATFNTSSIWTSTINSPAKKPTKSVWTPKPQLSHKLLSCTPLQNLSTNTFALNKVLTWPLMPLTTLPLMSKTEKSKNGLNPSKCPLNKLPPCTIWFKRLSKKLSWMKPKTCWFLFMLLGALSAKNRNLNLRKPPKQSPTTLTSYWLKSMEPKTILWMEILKNTQPYTSSSMAKNTNQSFVLNMISMASLNFYKKKPVLNGSNH